MILDVWQSKDLESDFSDVWQGKELLRKSDHFLRVRGAGQIEAGAWQTRERIAWEYQLS
jgi:hypothetical protein